MGVVDRCGDDGHAQKHQHSGSGNDAYRALDTLERLLAPHPDVASGNFVQAEFAADLWQVYLGEGSNEYRDPVRVLPARRIY